MTHPGLNGGNLHTSAHGAAPSHPGPHGNGQDPGPSPHPHPHPQHHASAPARPVFYVHAPPPPPFLHYQWPMPFSYNPFAGFPGMGYGMVMPPLPPPPFMEVPAYILPHPHVQAVDYRRLLHPQVHAPSAPNPIPIPNPVRRSRPSHSMPFRETVNSEVQTEPTHQGGGSPVASSDSGHGTASSSPSPTSGSHKRGSAKVDAYTLARVRNAGDFQVNGTSGAHVERGFNILRPVGTRNAQSRLQASPEESRKDGVGPEKVPPCGGGHCNMWSESSPDSMVPVCSSSQQKDKVGKERRVSIPDILMSWGGGTPPAMILKMAEKVLPHHGHQPLACETELEQEKCVCRSPAETPEDPMEADSTEINHDLSSCKEREALFKVLKLPFSLHDLVLDPGAGDESVELVGSVHHYLSYGDETNPHEHTAELMACQASANGGPKRRKMNESVWSVESLAPFFPTKEWLLQNELLEPEAIVEMAEEAQDCDSTRSDLPGDACERRRARRLSSSDCVPMSDSWLAFSTPAGKPSPPKTAETDTEIYAPEMRGPEEGRSMSPPGEHPAATLMSLQSEVIVPPHAAEGEDENRSSEPEATQSPNQESRIESEQRGEEEPPCSPKHEAAGERRSTAAHLIVDPSVADGARGSTEVRHEQAYVPAVDQKKADAPQSKGHLVDCGTQCAENALCSSCEGPRDNVGPNRRLPFKYSDVMNAGKAEGFHADGRAQKNQRRYGQRRNRGSEWSAVSMETHGSLQEAHNRYGGKSGRARGGNGRNPRY